MSQLQCRCCRGPKLQAPRSVFAGATAAAAAAVRKRPWSSSSSCVVQRSSRGRPDTSGQDDVRRRAARNNSGGAVRTITTTSSRDNNDASKGDGSVSSVGSGFGRLLDEQDLATKTENMLSVRRRAGVSAARQAGDAGPSNQSQLRWLTREIERTRNNRERIVVLGSGWAGYTLARELDKKKYQVVVVSPRSYFVFTPLLASTSVGTLEFRTALEPVRSRRTNVDFFQAWADRVDFANKTLTVEEAVENPRQGLALTGDENLIDGGDAEGKGTDAKSERGAELKKKGSLFDMSWDKLVIAVGCYSQTFGTPGVKEHAYFLKDVGDARNIRNRMLSCFETAALPTTSEDMKKQLLNFAIVGGGPTGIEFSAELHDIIREDMASLYPQLMQYYQITVYDVAPNVLSMFDEKLSKYAMKHFQRAGIKIKTSHHVQELRRGLPKQVLERGNIKDEFACFTLKLKEEGEIGVGMCVWSTGLMLNPFISNALRDPYELPADTVEVNGKHPQETKWTVRQGAKTGAVITNNRLRLVLRPEGQDKHGGRAVLKDVYALGDCATVEGTTLPATAQVANQKARWLAKHLNKGDIDQTGFSYRDLGVMAYIGNWNAIMQSSGGDVSGRFAWFIWRGAYLAKSVSWRNRILIPVYWFVNWMFGRDISRF